MAQESAEQGDSQGEDSARMAHRARLVKRFDKDGDGKLNDEEKAAMDRFIEERRNNNSSRERRGNHHGRREEMLKKYDKDEDGKLSDEERKAMLEDRAKRHPGGSKRGGHRQSPSED